MPIPVFPEEIWNFNIKDHLRKEDYFIVINTNMR